MKIHENSLKAHTSLKKSQRERMILAVLEFEGVPMTDRNIMKALNFNEPNAVRPRITELIQDGTLTECANFTDRLTGRRVRAVRLAGKPKQMEFFDE